MKLLVFAHTPPPHHGQSYMVQLMLAGFGGDLRRPKVRAKRATEDLSGAGAGNYGVECYHVNARVSQKLEDIGDVRFGKFILLLVYCLQAVWCRFRYGVTTLYYIPAPGKRSALYRDWLVMLICRPFYRRIVLHWHAAGLAKWLETVVQMRCRSVTYRLMKQVDLSIVLSKYNQADAEKLFSRQVKVISNGIPDPCPEFAEGVLPRRKARFSARASLFTGHAPLEKGSTDTRDGSHIIKVLYLAHCTREKGLFDSVEAVIRANRILAERRLPITMRLLVTGTFVRTAEKDEFDRILTGKGIETIIKYLGFVSGDEKNQLFREADLFCFPTYYQNENQPVNLIEAMAFGLPILTTRWRSIPELFPAKYPGLVDIRSPGQIAESLIGLATTETGEGFRSIFLKNFTLERHLSALAEALHQTEQDAPETATPSPALVTRQP